MCIIFVDKSATLCYHIFTVGKFATQREVINLDLEKFKTYLHDRHISINALADEIKISRQSLYLKLNGSRDFRAPELLAIADSLRMTTDEILDIFFNRQVSKNATN